MLPAQFRRSCIAITRGVGTWYLLMISYPISLPVPSIVRVFPPLPSVVKALTASAHGVEKVAARQSTSPFTSSAHVSPSGTRIQALGRLPQLLLAPGRQEQLVVTERTSGRSKVAALPAATSSTSTTSCTENVRSDSVLLMQL